MSERTVRKTLTFTRNGGYAAELMDAVAMRLGLKSAAAPNQTDLTIAAIRSRPAPVGKRKALLLQTTERSRGLHKIELTPEFVDDVIGRLAWGEPIEFDVPEANQKLTDFDSLSTFSQVMTTPDGEGDPKAVRSYLDNAPIVIVAAPGSPWYAATVEFGRHDPRTAQDLGFESDIVRRLASNGVMELFVRPTTQTAFASRGDAVRQAMLIASDPGSEGFVAIPMEEAQELRMPYGRRSEGPDGTTLPPDYGRLNEAIRRALRTFAAVGSPELRAYLGARVDFGWDQASEVLALGTLFQSLNQLCCQDAEGAKRLQQAALVTPQALFQKDIRRSIVGGASPAGAIIDWMRANAADLNRHIGNPYRKEHEVVASRLLATPRLEKTLSEVLAKVGDSYTARTDIERLIRMTLTLAAVTSRNPHLKPTTAQQAQTLGDQWLPRSKFSVEYTPNETTIARSISAGLEQGSFSLNHVDDSDLFGWAVVEIQYLDIDAPALKTNDDRVRVADVLIESAAIRRGGWKGKLEINNAWHEVINDYLDRRDDILDQLRSDRSRHEARRMERRALLTLPERHFGQIAARPVTTPHELKVIGRELGNCAGTYVRPVARGDSFIVRLDGEGERSLVELALWDSGFTVVQHEGADRTTPTNGHREVAGEYLEMLNTETALQWRLREVKKEVAQEGQMANPMIADLRKNPSVAADIQELVRKTFAELFLPKWMAEAGSAEILEYVAALSHIEHLTPASRIAFDALNRRPDRDLATGPSMTM